MHSKGGFSHRLYPQGGIHRRATDTPTRLQGHTEGLLVDTLNWIYTHTYMQILCWGFLGGCYWRVIQKGLATGCYKRDLQRQHKKGIHKRGSLLDTHKGEHWRNTIKGIHKGGRRRNTMKGSRAYICRGIANYGMYNIWLCQRLPHPRHPHPIESLRCMHHIGIMSGHSFLSCYRSSI